MPPECRDCKHYKHGYCKVHKKEVDGESEKCKDFRNVVIEEDYYGSEG